ncbi:MAG: aldehyde dehydrogenase family protein [Bdellovibrionales bacterium]
MVFQTFNPSTQEALQSYEYHRLEVALRELETFQTHQETWARQSLETRASRLREVAERLLSRREELARQASLEMGKPLSQAQAEVEKCARALQTLADLGVKALAPQEVAAHYRKTWLVPEPLGLILSVQPWNFPYWQLFRMAAGAWMAGNLVVLKHADLVAGCAQLIESVTNEGFDTHLILNLRLTHDEAAQVLGASQVRAVTLTGSTQAGRKIAEIAGRHLKKCVLELGGSDAYLVAADCDLESTVKICVQARLINSGQSCIAGKRFFVEEKIFDRFREAFLNEMRKLRRGSPFDSSTQVGPLAASRFVDALEAQIRKAQSEGAQFFATAEREGNYSRQGLLDFGDNLTGFESEEIFGPVALLYRVRDWDRVIQVLNHGPFGLGGGAFTTNLKWGHEMARRLQVGTFVLNQFVQSDPRVPFGGTRDSGFGREMGSQGLFEFVSWKVVGEA